MLLSTIIEYCDIIIPLKKKTNAENFSNTIYHKNKKLSILLEDLFEEEIVSIKTKSKL